MDGVVQRLNADSNSDSKFHRPPAKTDRLYVVLEPGTDPVFVMHPVPAPGSEYLYRENLPNIRRGAIASGRVVARNAAWRTEVRLTAVVNTHFYQSKHISVVRYISRESEACELVLLRPGKSSQALRTLLLLFLFFLLMLSDFRKFPKALPIVNMQLIVIKLHTDICDHISHPSNVSDF